jgi:hypothetical protein
MKRKLTSLTDEGVLVLISGVLGFIALLVLFGCSSTSSMACDPLLGREKDDCLERIKNNDAAIRYQMETSGNVR